MATPTKLMLIVDLCHSDWVRASVSRAKLVETYPKNRRLVLCKLVQLRAECEPLFSKTQYGFYFTVMHDFVFKQKVLVKCSEVCGCRAYLKQVKWYQCRICTFLTTFSLNSAPKALNSAHLCFFIGD